MNHNQHIAERQKIMNMREPVFIGTRKQCDWARNMLKHEQERLANVERLHEKSIGMTKGAYRRSIRSAKIAIGKLERCLSNADRDQQNLTITRSNPPAHVCFPHQREID